MTKNSMFVVTCLHCDIDNTDGPYRVSTETVNRCVNRSNMSLRDKPAQLVVGVEVHNL